MVLDGNSVVNRAFYGVRPLNTSDGTPTNAVFGFLNIYKRLMNEEAPEAVCVTFDLPAPTFRHEEYDQYKAQRKKMPDELAAQMPILKETLDAMNVRRFELAGWEADDLIGTISRICGEKGWDCVIVTGDRDSFQLIDTDTQVKHVKSHLGKTETKLYDEAAFREEYGFPPIEMVDLKALMGDASDNIPGVAGVGEKTAMDLVRRFGTVKSLYAMLDSGADMELKDAVRRKLEAGREQADLSYRLASIKCCAPIDFDPEACAVRPYDNDALFAVFKRLEFRRMAEVFGLTPPKTSAAAPAAAPGSAEEAAGAAEGKPAVFEGRCTSLDVTDGETLCAALKTLRASECCGVAFSDVFDTAVAVAGDGSDASAYILSREKTPDYAGVLRLVMAKDVRKAGMNVKDAMRALLGMGVRAEGFVFDAALAAYLLDPLAKGYDLSSLTEKYCGFTVMGGAGGGQLSLLTDSLQELARLCSSASAVLALRDALRPKLAELGLGRVFYDIELPLCPVLADMEDAGFLVDRKALSDFGTELSGGIRSLEARIYGEAGCEFNVNSPKQLGEVLFEKLMLPAPKKTKTGWSTNVDVLEKLRPMSPVPGLVLEYRELAKLKSTYADGLVTVIAPDGRIHTSFQMTVTATGRLSSAEPNLQNIPVRKELGAGIRKMFVAAPGNLLVDADYSQIELRLLAHISGDETMRATFRDGGDIHRATAAQVFGIAPEDVTATQRSRAKAVNFGIVYGISAFSLADNIGVPVYEAKEYIEKYLEKYHGVRDYMESVVKKAGEDGYVSTLFGRRRPMPELASRDRNLRAFGERVARNMPIQGTAADVMKIAMINAARALARECPSARLLLQVHDELIAECPAADAEKAAAVLKREMENAAILTVPLTVSVSRGESWFDAK